VALVQFDHETIFDLRRARPVLQEIALNLVAELKVS
jgi:hypothetical protein